MAVRDWYHTALDGSVTHQTVTVPDSDVNRDAVAVALAQALTDLQAILDSPDPVVGTLTAAQLSVAVRQLTTAVKTLALVQKRAIRYVTGDFTGTA